MRLTCKLKFIEDYMSVTLYMMLGVRCPAHPTAIVGTKFFDPSTMKPESSMRWMRDISPYS